MISIDTNILVFTHRADLKEHTSAVKTLKSALTGKEQCAFTHTVLHEFIATVTSHTKFAKPSTVTQAIAQISDWLNSPNSLVIYEKESHFQTLAEVVKQQKTTGQQIYDSQITAICIDNNVTTFITADQRFKSNKHFVVSNPL